MKTATATSVIIHGITAHPVEVTAEVAEGLVGLSGDGPTAWQKETFYRVRSALRASGYSLPDGKIKLSVKGDERGRRGPHLDLPVALALLALSGVVPMERLESLMLVGELGIDGTLRPVCGTICAARASLGMSSITTMIVPPETRGEAADIAVDARVARSLVEIVEWVNGRAELPRAAAAERTEPRPPVDLASVRVDLAARRALEISAAGGHPMLLVGAPGCGKTLLARALVGILPPLTKSESVTVTQIHSVSGLTSRGYGLVTTRPFRAPHMTASEAALVGGGNPPMPGEVSLAHNGVLFLDEAAEFRRASLEGLGSAVVDKCVTVARGSQTVSLPSDVHLVMAMSPCPCGYRGSPMHPCRCTPAQVRAYEQRVSEVKWLKSALHMRVELRPSAADPIVDSHETSAQVRERVVAARERQMARQGALNAHTALEAPFEVSGEVATFMTRTGEAAGIPASRWYNIIRVARTCADLAGSDEIKVEHAAEALFFRPA